MSAIGSDRDVPAPAAKRLQLAHSGPKSVGDPRTEIDDSERVRSIPLRSPPHNERSARSRPGPTRLGTSGAGRGFERRVGGALGYFARFRKP